jgi:hypothetical protein
LLGGFVKMSMDTQNDCVVLILTRSEALWVATTCKLIGDMNEAISGEAAQIPPQIVKKSGMDQIAVSLSKELLRRVYGFAEHYLEAGTLPPEMNDIMRTLKEKIERRR